MAAGPATEIAYRRRRRHPQPLAKRRDNDRSRDRERGAAAKGVPKRGAAGGGMDAEPGKGPRV